MAVTPCTTEELVTICTCGHQRGLHASSSGLGQCLHGVAECSCDAFLLAVVPVFTPDPLPGVPTAAEIDLEEARADHGRAIRLLILAARGRREYAKGILATSMAHDLETEAQAYEAAAKIAAGLDQTDVMKGLLPSWMWGEIDG